MGDFEQVVLGELRAIRRSQDDLNSRINIDRPFVVLREQLAKALDLLRTIPLGSRLCVVAGVLLLGAGVVYRSGKAAALGVDLLFASLLFVGLEVMD